MADPGADLTIDQVVGHGANGLAKRQDDLVQIAEVAKLELFRFLRHL